MWAPLQASVSSSVTWMETGVAEARTERPVVSVQRTQCDATTRTHSGSRSLRDLGAPWRITPVLAQRTQLLARGVGWR